MALHRHCALCGQPPAAAVNLGPLLGPVREARGGAAEELYVHRLCALWSSEVWETDTGTLRCVLAAIKRGRLVRCSHCGHRGATLGCRVPSCNSSYHVACAKPAGCTYYCESYQAACPDHAAAFRAEAQQQTRRTPFTPYRGAAPAAERGAPLAPAATPRGAEGEGEEGALVSPPTCLPPAFAKGRKRGRAAAAAHHILEGKAALKRARRELERRRRAEPESSDDDEHFQNKEARRLARDTAKLNPITLMGDGTAVQHLYIKSPPPPGKAGAAAAAPTAAAGQPALQPAGGRSGGGGAAAAAGAAAAQQQQPSVETAVVGSIAATDFSSVAGLDDVVRQLREMVLLPMQYPALFQSMGIRPPRGILFHGVPGTGKTLVARALAGACAKHSPRPVTFFARKGADCLGKFHGEAERTLRLLFEEAARRAPAIVFLDELDALVPCRSARAGGGDQIYASVVSTLLSLMDGVIDRGEVVVVGATNRPEAVDPALRRPGRFDREVYFGLPTPEQRLAILRVHTGRWARPPPEPLLRQVAARAEGFAGADLQALCTAAVMAAVRRCSPLLLEQAEREAGAVAATVGQAPPPLMPPQARQAQQQQPQQQDEQERAALRQEVLDAIEVQPCDWREALAAAPPPCSRRHGMAALAAEAATPLQQHALPLLARPLAQLLTALHAADLPVPPPAAEAASAATAAAAARAGGGEREAERHDGQLQAALEPLLLRHGALLPPPSQPAANGSDGGGWGAGPAVEAGKPSAAAAAAAADEEDEPRRLGRSYPPCRLLLWGEGEQGQEAAAGALLKLLDGCPVHCLSLPSLVAEGGDDAAAGCVALVGEALRRAGPSQPCIFYLPRLESWALSKAQLRPEDLADGGWYCLTGGGTAADGGSESDEEMGAAPEAGLTPRGGAGAGAGAMQSPRFAAPATSPRGGSPGHCGFLLAPSPFSGLLPLEDRVAHTPAVARALRSVTQLHRQQQEAGRQAAAPGGGGSCLDEGPTLQQRAASVEPGTGGRPPRPPPVLAPPAGLAPVRTSASPEQQQQAQQQQKAQQQQQAQQPAGAAGPGRGARGSRAQRTGAAPPAVAAPQPGGRASRAARTGAGAAAAPGQSQARRQAPAGTAPAAPAAPAAAVGGLLRLERDGLPAEGEDGSESEIEVACLSQAWSVFEALLRQAPASQPIIVLATCHAAADAVPANLAQFFAGPALPPPASAAAAAAAAPAEGGARQPPRGGLGQLLCEGEAPPDASAVAAPGIVRMGRPSAGAWQRAAAAAAGQVAASVATQAALLLHSQLQAAAAAQGGGEAGGSERQEAQQAGLQPPPAAPDERQADQQAPLQAQQAQQAEQQAQQQAQQAQQACNTAELEQGLRLLDRLLSFQRWLGAALIKERVAGLDRWVVPGGGGRRRPGQAGVLSFRQIAERCQAGGYDSVDALQAAAAATAAATLSAVEEAEQAAEARRRRQRGPASPGDRSRLQAVVTAACSVQDKIDSACFAARQSMDLPDASNERVLAAAAAHVRRLQRERDAELRAEAAERQRQAREEEEAQRRRQQAEQQQAEEERQHAEQQQQQQQQEPSGPQEQAGRGGEQQQEQQAAAGTAAEAPEAGAAHEELPFTRAEDRGLQQPAAAQRHEHCLLAAAREAAADGLTPPPSAPQQQEEQPQQQPEPMEQAGEPQQPQQAEQQQQQQAALQQQQQQQQARQRQAAHSAQLLRRKLCTLLLPAVQQRLPATPSADACAWQALQERAGLLATLAAAACSKAVEEAAGSCGSLLEADAAAAEQAVDALAARCMAALARGSA